MIKNENEYINTMELYFAKKKEYSLMVESLNVKGFSYDTLTHFKDFLNHLKSELYEYEVWGNIARYSATIDVDGKKFIYKHTGGKSYKFLISSNGSVEGVKESEYPSDSSIYEELCELSEKSTARLLKDLPPSGDKNYFESILNKIFLLERKNAR